MYALGARVLIGLFTALIFVLIQSVFLSNVGSTVMAPATICLIVVTYFRPRNGLLVLAALAPLGLVWSPLVDERMRGAEALVLAFLAGALLRGWTLHRFRAVTLDRLQMAALWFGLIVALSCAHQLWLRQVSPRTLLEYAAQDYVASHRGYTAIFNAMLFLEGLALLLYTVHYCRTQSEFALRLVRMLVVGGVAAAVYNCWFFVHELIETGQPAAQFWDFFLNRRWTAHVGDVNAAGSFFALIMFVALGLALKQQAYRVLWFAAGLVTGLGLWMTASRTALVAAAIVGAISLARVTIGRPRSVARLAFVAIGAFSAIVALATHNAWFRPASAGLAVTIRWEFLRTTWRMIGAYPLFGVGIGQYPQFSARFSSPLLLAFYPRENAHNNFAQVAGELGLVGLAAFVVLLALCFWPPRRSRRDPAVVAIVAGVAAFIVSWLGGHPLLVPEVAYPFWLALGIVASRV
jgi:O-antigen ligase